MIDLHCHTIFSDGDFIPLEMIRRYQAVGYTGVVLSDHGDSSNLDFVIPRLAQASITASRTNDIKVAPGIELTHIPPEQMKQMVKSAREAGASLISVHGETIVEPVFPGTNREALLAGIDFLAHPGLITEDDVKLAVHLKIPLEVTTRAMHAYTNGHVVAIARRFGASLVINNDAHKASDIVPEERTIAIARGAGMTGEEIEKAFEMSARLLDIAIKRRIAFWKDTEA